MTPAEKSAPFNALFWLYIRRLLRRQFSRMLFRPCELALDRPTLYISNHHTWWDGFFAFALNERYLHQDLHLMMGAEQFEKFRFFRKLGVFSVDPSSPTDAAAAFRYSVRVLRRQGAPSLWIFPAGEMLPYGGEVRYRDGFARIACAAGDVQIVPVAFRATFLKEQHPDVAILFGPPLSCAGRTPEEVFALGCSELTRLAKDLDGRVARGELNDFQVLLPGRVSVSQRFAALRGRA